MGSFAVGGTEDLYATSNDGRIYCVHEKPTPIPHPWPMFRHDARHSGRSEYTGTLAAGLKWSYDLLISRSSCAVSANGEIYAGSWDNCLYCVDTSGLLRWSYATGDNIDSSPAIGEDGAVHFGSNDTRAYCLTSSGTLQWSFG